MNVIPGEGVDRAADPEPTGSMRRRTLPPRVPDSAGAPPE